jgi:hypothetical protein
LVVLGAHLLLEPEEHVKQVLVFLCGGGTVLLAFLDDSVDEV